MSELEKYIYDEMIEIILREFSEAEKNEVCSAYKDYIISNYSDSENLDSDIEKVKKVTIKIEHMKWDKSTKREKQILLLNDENLNKLGFFSDIAQKYALYRKRGRDELIDMTKEEIDSCIEEMKMCFDLVRDFNKDIARNYLSEGIIDFEYALGLSENTSFRVGM